MIHTSITQKFSFYVAKYHGRPFMGVKILTDPRQRVPLNHGGIFLFIPPWLNYLGLSITLFISFLVPSKPQGTETLGHILIIIFKMFQLKN